MGQKVNPISLRLGIIKGWDSNWYGGKSFADNIVEDHKIRKYLLARITKAVGIDCISMDQAKSIYEGIPNKPILVLNQNITLEQAYCGQQKLNYLLKV